MRLLWRLLHLTRRLRPVSGDSHPQAPAEPEGVRSGRQAPCGQQGQWCGPRLGCCRSWLPSPGWAGCGRCKQDLRTQGCEAPWADACLLQVWSINPVSVTGPLQAGTEMVAGGSLLLPSGCDYARLLPGGYSSSSHDRRPRAQGRAFWTSIGPPLRMRPRPARAPSEP